MLAGAVLALAAFNVTFRLGEELVTEWDESLFALSAWEMLQSGQWLVTTLFGQVDYYNTKPPLNVWMIALSVKAFGISLVSLRLPSALSAWCTVLCLLLWLRRPLGARAAIVSAVVLATSFGFLHAHSGRSANADAPFTLAVLLTVITLAAMRDRPWRGVWLGPTHAAAFLLKGPAVLMPLAITAIFEVWCRRTGRGTPTRVLAVAATAFVIPVALWTAARWQIDGWAFIAPMVGYDFVKAALSPLEGHGGSALFYARVLQQDQVEWVLAGAVALVCCRPSATRLIERLRPRAGQPYFPALIAIWAAVTFLVPTAMQTKLPWYLNPFYPAFAVLVGWSVEGALREWGGWPARGRLALAALFVAALVSAEARFGWYSFAERGLMHSRQGALLGRREALANRTLFSPDWSNGEWFVLQAFVGATPRLAPTVDDFLLHSRPGDIFLAAEPVTGHRELTLLSTGDAQWLYCRVGDSVPAGDRQCPANQD